MSRIPANLSFPPPETSTNSQTAALSEVDLDQFLRLMIAELQNQDPLDPLDNTEMLQQITQIREIGSNDKLADTLDAVLAGQHLATASGLIGRRVSALSDSGQNVLGTVDRVSVEVGEGDTNRRVTKVHIGDLSIGLENIRQIE
jgi:flagellar basal-body rod modification protein FlgD